MQSTIVTKTIKEAVKLLNATGAKYVVVDLEGTEYSSGNLKLAAPEKEPTRKKATHREYGALAAHFLPYVENLKVGAVTSIPLYKFATEKEALRGAASAWCSMQWGKNSHKSCITDTAVEILRTA